MESQVGKTTLILLHNQSTERKDELTRERRGFSQGEILNILYADCYEKWVFHLNRKEIQ